MFDIDWLKKQRIVDWFSLSSEYWDTQAVIKSFQKSIIVVNYHLECCWNDVEICSQVQ